MDIQSIIQELKEYIPNPSSVMGSIDLPSSIGDATISWKSSNPAVISDEWIGAKRPGVVCRDHVDQQVMLTATVTLFSQTEQVQIPVMVQKAPEEISDDDFAGYLFGHFIGEETPKSEQIYFALSSDGLHFADLNNCQPVLESTVGECGVRDPYLYRSAEGDRFFLVATDLSIHHRGGWFQNEQGYYDASTTGSSFLVLWQSTDLIHWGEPALIKTAPKNAGMAWAPEIIYYETTAEYLIFFSSSIMNPETKYKAKPNAIYYVATRDFVHYSEPKLLIDNQCSLDGKQKREIIDTTILKIGDWYYSASKDGDNAEEDGGILILKTQNLLDPSSWIKVLDLDDLALDLGSTGLTVLDNSSLEGPELFRYNKRDWADPSVPEYGIMADQYMLGTGYLPLKTTDIEDSKNERGSWKLLSSNEYSFDRLRKRHGTIMPITSSELERLKKFF